MDGIFEFVGGKVYDYFKITNSNEVRRSYRPDSLHLFSCETSHYIFIAIFLAPAPHLQDHVLMGIHPADAAGAPRSMPLPSMTQS